MTGRQTEDSKKNFTQLRENILSQQGKRYWRSLEEFVDAPEFEDFVQREFPQHAEQWDDPVSRRSFLKLMGASLALAGLSSACVIQPPEKIIPYVKQPEEIVPGKALFFATAMTLRGVAVGLLAKSQEGRPTKIEGNPEHPGSLGSTDRRAQASLLDMYDPDRSQNFLYRNTPRSYDRFVSDVRSIVEDQRKSGGAGIRFLTETITSPTLIGQFRQILSELPNARWYQYEPCNNDNALTGAKMAFGENVQTTYNFAEADRVLSLDSDFLSEFNVRYVRDFSERRRVSNGKREMNRLYIAETSPTITGAKADHRLALKPSEFEDFARALATAVGVGNAGGNAGNNAAWIAACAKDLRANGAGRSIVIAGDNQPPVIHALAHSMNAALGNTGKTVIYREPIAADTAGANARTQLDGLRELVADVDRGAVQMLVMIGGNPAYNTPADLRLDIKRLGAVENPKVPFRVHLSTHVNETSSICHWVIPQTHFLEEWSDGRAFDGTATLVQPLIAPLYGGKSAHEVVQLFANENYERNGFDIVKDFWQKQGLGANLKPLVATTTGAAATRAVAASNSASVNQNNQNQAKNVANDGSSNNSQQTNSTNDSKKSSLSTERQSTPNALPSGQGPDSTAAQQNRGNNLVPKNNAADSSAGGTSPSAATTVSAPVTNFDDAWRKAIHDGMIANTASATRNVAPRTDYLAQTANIAAGNGNNMLEVVILPDHSIDDGRFANNGWLQELPKPLNKVTWDNVVLLSPKTADRLGLNQGRTKYQGDAGASEGSAFVATKGGNLYADVIELEINGNRLRNLPVWVQPGTPDETAVIFLGYGRSDAGKVGSGLGYNAYEARTSNALDFAVGTLTKTDEQYELASTQSHFNMEGRDIIRVRDLDEYLENERGHFEEEDKDLYPESMYERYNYSEHNWQHKWGMAIDQNSCVGCNACVLACQAENNIPVVGKDQVKRRREMQWLRVDAYYEGEDSNNPEGPYFQPMLCQHCEQAPCEPVCPVHATVHDSEGLNVMVYNRCVGTRYCSNNCPYKVRRFNFLLYQDWYTPQYTLMRNTEVTVRSRGVMEKCTYCVQRIALGRIEAQKTYQEEKRVREANGQSMEGLTPRIQDGAVVTACQAVCPANAITFGDLNDPNSAVNKAKKEPREYSVLNNLNTQPRTTYSAVLKNQNREMPDYKPHKNENDKPESPLPMREGENSETPKH